MIPRIRSLSRQEEAIARASSDAPYSNTCETQKRFSEITTGPSYLNKMRCISDRRLNSSVCWKQNFDLASEAFKRHFQIMTSLNETKAQRLHSSPPETDIEVCKLHPLEHP